MSLLSIKTLLIVSNVYKIELWKTVSTFPHGSLTLYVGSTKSSSFFILRDIAPKSSHVYVIREVLTALNSNNYGKSIKSVTA